MKIKRNYKDGRCDNVDIIHTGIQAKQNFSTRLVAGALQEGWMEMKAGKIILKANPEDLVYTIIKEPGYYCCHDGKKLDDANMAKTYVEQHFAGIPSPDPNNPLGYMKINHYECVLDSAQHEKYKVGAIQEKKKTTWQKIKEFVNG